MYLLLHTACMEDSRTVYHADAVIPTSTNSWRVPTPTYGMSGMYCPAVPSSSSMCPYALTPCCGTGPTPALHGGVLLYVHCITPLRRRGVLQVEWSTRNATASLVQHPRIPWYPILLYHCGCAPKGSVVHYVYPLRITTPWGYAVHATASSPAGYPPHLLYQVDGVGSAPRQGCVRGP